MLEGWLARRTLRRLRRLTLSERLAVFDHLNHLPSSSSLHLLSLLPLLSNALKPPIRSLLLPCPSLPQPKSLSTPSLPPSRTLFSPHPPLPNPLLSHHLISPAAARPHPPLHPIHPPRLTRTTTATHRSRPRPTHSRNPHRLPNNLSTLLIEDTSLLLVRLQSIDRLGT